MGRETAVMQEARERELWREVLPEFAPLPPAYVELLFEHPQRFQFPLPSHASLFEQIWINVQLARGNVLGYMFPFVRAEKLAPEQRLSITWLTQAVQGFDPQRKRPTRQTIADWQSRSLLRSRGFGIPEPNAAAALLIMRSLSSLRRDWLPGTLEPNEPWFWVWGQQPGAIEPRLYPYPLPADLPAHTLLWSTWGGAAWLPGWKGVRQYGALAWAKTVQFREQTWWNVTADALAAWEPPFVEHASLNLTPQLTLPGFPVSSIDEDRYALMRLHTLADELLSRIGEPLLYRTLQRYYASRVPPCFDEL